MIYLTLKKKKLLVSLFFLQGGVCLIFHASIRFLIEICALVAVGYWGFQTVQNPIIKVLLGIGSPFFIAVIWTTFVSPAAPYRLQGMFRFMLEMIIFGLAGLALYLSGKQILAAFFIGLAVINAILIHLFEQS